MSYTLYYSLDVPENSFVYIIFVIRMKRLQKTGESRCPQKVSDCMWNGQRWIKASRGRKLGKRQQEFFKEN